MGVRFSTGCVSVYVAGGCGGPDLPEAVPEGGAFRSWYILSAAKNVLISRWDNGDVWGSDFRDAGGGDIDPGGGADYPDLYFFAGSRHLPESSGGNQSRLLVDLWQLW